MLYTRTSVADPNERGTTAEPASFDVRRWLAELTGLEGWVVERTFTRHKVEFVAAYTASGGAAAQVTMHALPTASQASWELVARANGQVAGVVIPARTRISW